MEEFVGFPKMARLAREIVVTEKIDGTNAQVYITEDGQLYAGSRTRWITPQSDNFGFAQWVEEHQKELLKLGPGRHFGEWWGRGIQRGYNCNGRHFSLFNVSRWGNDDSGLPGCCELVPVLYRGVFSEVAIESALWRLRTAGSFAAPGFPNPEGVVVYHIAAGVGFKKTLENDDVPKSKI